MKALKVTLALVIVVVTVFALASCGTYATISSAFKKAGYNAVDTSEDETANKIVVDIEKGKISYTPHLFQTTTTLIIEYPVYALVLEFGSDEEALEYLQNEASETVKGFITDAQDSQFVNGNCILIPLTLTKASEMIEIFNQNKK